MCGIKNELRKELEKKIRKSKSRRKTQPTERKGAGSILATFTFLDTLIIKSYKKQKCENFKEHFQNAH